MKKSKHILQLLAMIMVFSSFTPDGAPEGEHENYLFKINRSRDADEIWYTVNINESGVLDKEKPIEAFWVRKTKNNEREPLSWVQNNYAYGIQVIQPYSRVHGNLRFQFVSYPQQTFELRKSVNGQFQVYTNIDTMEIEVARIFVQIDGDSFLVPSVSHIKLTGYDVASSNLVAQTITP